MQLSLMEMDAHSYGTATVAVTNWISKMVHLHLDIPNLNDIPDSDDDDDEQSSDPPDVDYDEMYQDQDDNNLPLRRQKSMPLTLKNAALGQISDEIKTALKDVKNWNFDVFKFFDLCGDFSLSIIGVHVLKQTGMLDRLNVNEAILAKFLHTIQQSYKEEVAYHNAIHAADVCISLHALMSSRRFSNGNQTNSKYTCQLKQRLRFRADEILTAYIGALCHDVAHPGFNNAFQINSESDLAILYNDQSVLENFHIATTYRVLKMQGNDFTLNSKVDPKRMRKLMTHLILHTDMAYHTRVVDHIELLKATKIVQDEQMEMKQEEELLQKQGVSLPAGKRIKLKPTIPHKASTKKKSPRVEKQKRKLNLDVIGEEQMVDAANMDNKVDTSNLKLSSPRKPAMSLMNEDEDDNDHSNGLGANDGVVEWTETDKYDFLSGLMHACDISNPCKDKTIMLEWSMRLYSEFYNQGDKERELGLPVSEICDRNNPKREAASIGFANFIVKPLFQGLKPFFKICDLALITLDKNTKYWKDKMDSDSD